MTRGRPLANQLSETYTVQVSVMGLSAEDFEQRALWTAAGWGGVPYAAAGKLL